MLKSPILLGMIGLLLVQPCYAGSSESELLDKYNEDPSLLLDPSTYVEAPPEERQPASAPEAVAPAVEEAPIQIVEPTPQIVAPVTAAPVPEMPAVEEMEIKISEAPAEEKPVVEEKEVKVSEVPAAPAVSVAPAEPPVPVAEAMPAVPAVPVVLGPPEPSKPELVKSEMVALPGVTDFSIILSGEQFFPSVIRMKQNGNKNRLLFVTTGAKPAALVFVKPRIQRWIASQSDSKSVEEYREVGTSKVTEIEFDAEPGVYEYYDALSGARGEIKVE
jgi:hypothetical protein